MDINSLLAQELNIHAAQINATIRLLDDGASVPFIARYRKEATGGLDDTQLRTLEERLHYLRELDERKQVILKSINEQNKLTPELAAKINNTYHKAILEDLYLPFKPKRRTKAQIAKEAGLEPLALNLLNQANLNPTEYAKAFIHPEKGIHDIKEALDGARHILMECFSEDAALLTQLRQYILDHAILNSQVIEEQKQAAIKFNDYFAYHEAIKTIPSHRALALLRGQRESYLTLKLSLNTDEETHCKQLIQAHFKIKEENNERSTWLIETIALTFKVKLFLKFELELMNQLREQAEEEAIRVFANNLKHLLMAAPAGSRVTLGLDPGLRTGVKVVVVDGTGKLLTHTVIFPHAPQKQWQQALHTLASLCQQYHVELISIGNGTASRETDQLVQELKQLNPQLNFKSLVISEAGASVYSASELAANEFPDLDVSYRGAVSIARRLQDPLAELVKIEPKAIGVGQYQHDVNQVKLSRALKAVMEDCVNAVGVDLNTASVPLLGCIAGINTTIANNIMQYRNEHGAFLSREHLKKVPRLGEKAFEQAAGFLRITNGSNPLDASAVHPEAYGLVETILEREHKTLNDILGNTAYLKTLKPQHYVNDRFGLPTVTDILKELDKPGRDPRPEFKTAHFKEDVNTITDLKPGMVLEGVVTNVANFGAFVDIGVHQDGLVHISMLAERFVKDPNDIIKVGDIVKVKVIEIDIARKRISLSMKLSDASNTQHQINSQKPNKPTKINKTVLDTSFKNAFQTIFEKKP